MEDCRNGTVLGPWLERFDLGIAEIDADHRRFFDYVERVAAEGDAAARQALFAEVVEDLAGHMAREDAILAEAGYDRAAEHRVAHQVLATQARHAVSVCRDGDWRTALRLLAAQVLEHIAVEDVKARPFLK